MLRLNTFGGLSLHQGDSALTGAPTQRRRLALLAILAVAGEKGVSRDKLLAMLWPDGDPEKSRHALNQILSAQRRYFSDAQLFDGRKTVRLNPKVITTDASELETALAAKDFHRAINLYTGPFLDGFFVPNSAEFEMWASDQRNRFANKMADALDDAARQAQSEGDVASAVKWRRRACEIDPSNVAFALRFADALLAEGNRAGALRALRDTQERISEELGIAGDPEISARIARIARELNQS